MAGYGYCFLAGLAMVCIRFALNAEAITCGEAVGDISSCLGYLRSGGTPSYACCAGVKKLNSSANTTAARRAACQCLKSAANGLPGINYTYAGQLPMKCGVNLSFKISNSTDCSKIP